MRIQGLLIGLKRDLAVAAVDLRSRHARMFEEFNRWLCVTHQRMLQEVMPGRDGGATNSQDLFGTESDGKGGARQELSQVSDQGPKHKPETSRRLRR